jgi:predicted phage terminase large subunit-like protein
MGYDYLMIPMEFEPSRRIITSIGWTDPRNEEGQLMFEKRFPKDVVERDKAALGPYAAAGQLQQLPVPRKGGLFEVDRLRTIPAMPLGVRKFSVRGWDLAGTEGAGAYTAGVKVSYIFDTKRVVIEDVRRERFSPNRVRRLLQETASLDGVQTFISIPKDPGQAGKAQAEDLITELAGYSVVKEPQSGSKELRAEPLASQVEAGNVDLIEAPWNEAFVNEMRFFPRGTFKDQIDAASSAFNLLMAKVKYHSTGELNISGETTVSWTSQLGHPENTLGMNHGSIQNF